jgi:hypothetical protein
LFDLLQEKQLQEKAASHRRCVFIEEQEKKTAAGFNAVTMFADEQGTAQKRRHLIVVGKGTVKRATKQGCKAPMISSKKRDEQPRANFNCAKIFTDWMQLSQKFGVLSCRCSGREIHYTH